MYLGIVELLFWLTIGGIISICLKIGLDAYYDYKREQEEIDEITKNMNK